MSEMKLLTIDNVVDQKKHKMMMMKKKWKTFPFHSRLQSDATMSTLSFKHCFRLGEDTDRKKIINENYESYATKQSVIKSHQLMKTRYMWSFVVDWSLKSFILNNVVIAFYVFMIDKTRELINFCSFVLQAQTKSWHTKFIHCRVPRSSIELIVTQSTFYSLMSLNTQN